MACAQFCVLRSSKHSAPAAASGQRWQQKRWLQCMLCQGVHCGCCTHKKLFSVWAAWYVQLPVVSAIGMTIWWAMDGNKQVLSMCVECVFFVKMSVDPPSPSNGVVCVHTSPRPQMCSRIVLSIGWWDTGCRITPSSTFPTAKDS